MLARLLIALLVLACATASASAQIQPGSTPPAGIPPSITAPPSSMPPPPFGTPAPLSPGLYAGIKDQEGVAVSWVRINGVRDRGRVVPFVRGEWGAGIVNVPLLDLSSAEIYYSDGHIQMVMYLRNGQVMQVQIADPAATLEGWWSANDYSVPIMGIRQIWFHFVPRTAAVSERYTGPTIPIRVDGIVQEVDLRGSGGFLTLLSGRGDRVDMRFDYARIRKGKDLLKNRSPWLPGRTVRVIYQLSASPEGRAQREVREVELLDIEVVK